MKLTTEDYKNIQSKLLEIIKYFDEFCKKHHIEYFLIGGTLLGAFRHKGFIPWDDDLDVCMSKKNYDKFISVAKKELDTDTYYLQEGGTEEFPKYFSKLRMNNTTFLEENDKNKKNFHKGFFIDIFYTYHISDNLFTGKIQHFYNQILTAKTLVKYNYKTSSLLKKIVCFFTKTFISDKIEKYLLKYLLKTVETKKISVLGEANSIIFPSIFFKHKKQIAFEDIELPIFYNSEYYLEKNYGKNYMQIPNMKTRDKYRTHCILYDTEKDYTFYEKLKS